MHDSSPVLLLQYVFIPFLHMSELMKAWHLIFVKLTQDNEEFYKVTNPWWPLGCVCVGMCITEGISF